MRKLSESCKKVMRKTKDSHETVMRQLWYSHETVMRQWWDSHEPWYSHYSTPVADRADIIVLVCSMKWSVTSLLGGHLTMACLLGKAMVRIVFFGDNKSQTFFCAAILHPLKVKVFFSIWDHFFSLLFPEDSKSLKLLDIQLWEVGAKRLWNGTSKVNTRTEGHTNGHFEGQFFANHKIVNSLPKSVKSCAQLYQE